MPLRLRRATPGDVAALAQMNRQLIMDEQSRNPMTLDQLTRRMRHWLTDDWHAVLLLVDHDIAGYALFQVRADEYQPSQSEVYLCQLFIKQPQRRKGWGRIGFEMLSRDFFPAGATIVCDVLETSPGAAKFWRSLGFLPYATTYQMGRKSL
jgi:ribosomal protein S18 acetylase RimI-like enzyme